MSLIHVVAGYDKSTEQLTFEHEVPEDAFAEIRALADVPASDVHVLGAYPLSAVAARSVSQTLAKSLNVDGYDWFLEPQAT